MANSPGTELEGREVGAARLGKRRSEWAGTVAERFRCVALFRYEEIETKGVELLVYINAASRTSEYSDRLSAPRRDTSGVRLAGSAAALKFGQRVCRQMLLQKLNKRPHLRGGIQARRIYRIELNRVGLPLR